MIAPTPGPRDRSETLSGCAVISFDPSSALVATRLEDSPSTVWIWDMKAAELRAVLLFHGNIGGLSWHPHLPETLLVKCEGDQYTGLVFVWDPLWEGPQTVDFGQHLPGARTLGKPHALWLGIGASSRPSLFFSDAQNYLLACLGEMDHGSPPWGGPKTLGPSYLTDGPEESPLELVPATAAPPEAPGIQEDDDCSELEDTFVHKR